MKINIIGPAHPYRGGIAALNERLAEQFQREGHQVNIITFTLQYPGFLFPGKTQYTNDPPSFNLKIERKINAVNPISWITTGNYIKKEKPDLVIVRFWLPFMAPGLGTICRRIRKNKHSKIIALVDNIIPHETRPGDKIFTKYFTKSVDAFIAMSGSVYSDLNLFDIKKQKKLTPHPIYDHYGEIEKREVALEKLNLDSDFRYILFFGFIRNYKGLDLLLEAFSDPYFNSGKIKLIIAGEFYSNKEFYIKLIQKLNIKNRVVLKTDFIPDSVVQNYFNAADLVAQPYKSATQSGITQIGYHFNKPMLVTNVGGLSEIIPHMKVGYVVEPNTESIKEALIDFFENQRISLFTQNIQAEKKRFAWEKMTTTIYNLKNEL